MRLERRLEGRDQLLKLVEGQAGQIQELRGAGLHVGEPYMAICGASFMGGTVYHKS